MTIREENLIAYERSSKEHQSAADPYRNYFLSVTLFYLKRSMNRITILILIKESGKDRLYLLEFYNV